MIPRTAQSALLPAVTERIEQDDDGEVFPYTYGYRYERRFINGEEDWVEVPLTLDDVLHPQLDDCVNQSSYHFYICSALTSVLLAQLKHTPGLLVLSDVLINWDMLGMKTHAPDIVVFRDVHTIPEDESYSRLKHGGQPVLIIEITSPSTRNLDVAAARRKRSKYIHYRRVGVSYYILIDEARRRPNQAPPFWGYRLGRRNYSALRPNAHGHLWIPPIHMALGQHEKMMAWYDANGNRILDLAEQTERAEQEWLRAEQERLRAEQAEARACAAEEELKRLKAKYE